MLQLCGSDCDDDLEFSELITLTFFSYLWRSNELYEKCIQILIECED